MSQTAELARVKTQIKALTDKTIANGCTEAEAMSPAEMVGRLLERYALSMDEIEMREARCVLAEAYLLASLRDAEISIAHDARPVFLDPAPRPLELG